MSEIEMRRSRWSTVVVILSLLLLFFTIPHTLEDFATGEPAKAGVPAPLISTVVAGIIALQALALLWIGRQKRRGYLIHAFIGLFWPLAAGVAQLPAILSQGSYRAGFISVFYVVGILVVGISLFIVSILALRVVR